MRKLLREPFVHFVLLGVLLFIGHSFWAAKMSADARTIFVSDAEMERQALIFAGEQRRVPSDDDLEALLYAYVEEEALVRDAQALGLGADDTIIRRRLAQKMRFLIEDVEPPDPPNDKVLKAWFETRKAEFSIPARTDFTHIYFSPGIEGPAARANETLPKLSVTDDGKALGDPFIMKRVYTQMTNSDVARLFGSEFSAQLSAVEAGDWQGPLTSALGVHLVKVSARSNSSEAIFDEVREVASQKWMEDTRRAENAERLQELIAKYKVEVEEPK